MQVVFPFGKVEKANFSHTKTSSGVQSARPVAQFFNDTVGYLLESRSRRLQKGSQAGRKKGAEASVKLSVLHPHILPAALNDLQYLKLMIEQNGWPGHGEQQLFRDIG